MNAPGTGLRGSVPVAESEVTHLAGCVAHVGHDRTTPDADLLSPLTIQGVTIRNRIVVLGFSYSIIY
jgi:hypothetical protein